MTGRKIAAKQRNPFNPFKGASRVNPFKGAKRVKRVKRVTPP